MLLRRASAAPRMPAWPGIAPRHVNPRGGALACQNAAGCTLLTIVARSGIGQGQRCGRALEGIGAAGNPSARGPRGCRRRKKTRPSGSGLNDTFGQGDRGTEETLARERQAFAGCRHHRWQNAPSGGALCQRTGTGAGRWHLPVSRAGYQAVFLTAALRAVALACWAALLAAEAAAWKLLSAISTACLVAFWTDS